MAITSSIENRRCAFTLHTPSDDATTAATVLSRKRKDQLSMI